MKHTIIANLKSHKTSKDIEEWLSVVDGGSKDLSNNLEIIVAIPYTYLYTAQNLKNIKLSAQNVSPFPPGAYTGEINAHQLKDMCVEYCIVGHSERRRYFHETNQDILNKIDTLMNQNITPIVCIGDQEYRSQITALSQEQKAISIFAYEPTSSIGTGNPADPSTVSDISGFIHDATDRPVLYGGSVSDSNTSQYTSIKTINGFLVGSKALDPHEFLSILHSV